MACRFTPSPRGRLPDGVATGAATPNDCQLCVTETCWNAVLVAVDWIDAALNAIDEFEAQTLAQLFFPKNVRVSRAGSSSTRSLSSSVKVSSLRIVVTSSRCAEICEMCGSHRSGATVTAP